MKYFSKCVLVISSLLFLSSLTGCDTPAKEPLSNQSLMPESDLGVTLGSLVEVFSVSVSVVEGYGIVGGLQGTGSSECPGYLRTYFEKYIQQQQTNINADELLNSHDTAVVVLQGITLAESSKGDFFDLRIKALSGTQTTSLKGGWLYSAELKAAGRFGTSLKVLAKAQGPVFIDTIDKKEQNERDGYVLAGGRIVDDYMLNLMLREADYRKASIIRNRLNERYGKNIAKALSPNRIELKVPGQYKKQKAKFVSIIRATYLSETDELTRKRANTHARDLVVSDNKDASEALLEAIGKASLGRLRALLNSSDVEVELRAARCMLNIGDDGGLNVLRKIATDKNSIYRTEALEAIAAGARREDAASISRRLLRDEDFEIMQAAYENLQKIDDIAITRTIVADSFHLDRIAQTTQKEIFVARSGKPRIALFGAPIYCKDNLFIQSKDGTITINAPAGQKYVSLMRKHPKRPNVVLQLQSTFKLSDIIQTLCESTVSQDGSKGRVGLGVSYDNVISILKQMSEKGAVEAGFHAGPLPKIGINIKK